MEDLREGPEGRASAKAERTELAQCVWESAWGPVGLS